MFLLGEFLFGSLFHVFEAFLPFIIICLIISLITRSSKGKQTAYGYVKPGEVLMDGVDEKAKVSNPGNATAMNILLYIGGFLIIGSILLFIRDEPSLVPFFTFFITIIAYAAGMLLYRFVDYLRPVATAFTYTAMVLFPLWFYAFTELGMSSGTALFVSTIITFFAYAAAATGIDSRIAGWLSYIWLLLTGWTWASMVDTNSASRNITTYAFFIWPLIVAIFPTICWARRVKWLPVAYRRATKAFAQYLTPVFATFTFLTIFTPNISDECPALRIVASSIATIGGLIGWLSNRKKHGLLVSLRVYLQMLILMIVADSVGYSVISPNSTSAEITMAITWLATWLGQTICSLFVPQKTEDDKMTEKPILVFSLIGIFSTWIFCLHFDAAARAAILIAIAAVIAVLGIAISLRYKNISWANATVLATMFIPIEIFAELMPSGDYAWAIFGTYTILTLFFLCIYTFISIAKIQPERSRNVALTAVITGSIATIVASTCAGWGSAGWLASSVFLASISIIGKKYSFLEGATYLAAIALANFIFNINSRINWFENGVGLNLAAIEAHIIALPIITFGFIKERHNTSGSRKVLGFLLLTIPMFIIASSANAQRDYILPLIFIFEGVGLTILGVFTKHKWMYITSAILITLITLELTGGFNGVWLLLVGIGLIVFVAWQLAKNTKKPQ